MKDASSFRTFALIGVAAAFCAVVKNGGCREGGALPTNTKALTSACPPEWLPVLLAFNSGRDDSSTFPLDALSTWQCNPDGSVSQNGVTVDASTPCNWGLAGPNRAAETQAGSVSRCAGAETLAAIEKKEVDRRNLQVVLVRHDEDISWSDSFAAVRTVYEKPGTEFLMLPLTLSSGAGPAAPEAASVVLPNVGKEQHAYLTHVVRNYDSLANWTVFLHGKMPTCGFFLADEHQMGNHLLTNVSVLDYLMAEGDHGGSWPSAEGDLYMPLTGRANHDLTLSSFRSTFADGLDPRPRVSRPVTAYPTHGGDKESEAEESGGDRWLKWEVNDLSKYAKKATFQQGVLLADELIDFKAFFQRVVGREPPAVLYFTQGAQFSASRAALRSTPKATYKWILELVEAGHFEVTFYLEMMWLYMLHGAPEAHWTATTIDQKEAAPFLDHLLKARLLLRVNADSEEQRRSLVTSPEPEVPSPPPPSPSPPLPAPPSGPECAEIHLPVHGWQMISFNCIGGLSNTFEVLESAPWNADDKIMTRDPFLKFATFNGVTFVGGLINHDQLLPSLAYRIYYTGDPANLTQTGMPQLPVENVVLRVGWNWIGHAPFDSFAIESLKAISGQFNADDQIKTRTGTDLKYTTYTGAFWAGGILNLMPGLGYEVKVSQAVSFCYAVGASCVTSHLPIQ